MLIMSVGNSLNHIRNMAFIKFASGIIFMVCLVFSQSSSSKNKATRINEASILETLLALVSQGNVVDGKSFQFIQERVLFNCFIVLALLLLFLDVH